MSREAISNSISGRTKEALKETEKRERRRERGGREREERRRERGEEEEERERERERERRERKHDIRTPNYHQVKRFWFQSVRTRTRLGST